jgi:hypothetical protein
MRINPPGFISLSDQPVTTLKLLIATAVVAATTAYDPTCGSGPLLLKVAAQAGKHITLEGQEKGVTTAGLARMDMILHDFPTVNILSGKHPVRSQVQGPRTVPHLRLCRRQSALLRQDLVDRPHALAGSFPA